MLAPMRSWSRRSARTCFAHPLLTLEVQQLATGEGEERQALVLTAPDWVNVIPLLPDGRVVMVRQWRFGIAAPTLEIPGGIVEDASAAEAARRELREETGYHARTLVPLGEVSPNPAILTNRCATFLATDLELVGEPQSGIEEELVVELVPLADVPRLIRGGEVHHALVVAAFHLLTIADPATLEVRP
jgi:8-oxo-dGTP pyrophosphatase MutT (NUDIX family)